MKKVGKNEQQYEKSGFRTSTKERASFALFMTGQTIFNQFFNGYSQKFMTEMGITAATVGLIVVAVRIFDAVNDPIFGGIVDRSNLKGGKFLPWLKMSTILMPVFAVALFLMPQTLTTSHKIVWSSIFATLFSGAYTICDVPVCSMVSAVTDNVQERVKIMSNNSIYTSLATLIIFVTIPIVYPKIGWGVTGIIVAALAVPTMIPMGRNGKERFVNKDTEKVTIKAMFTYVKANKYMRTYFTGLLILYAFATTAQTATFFADFNLGDVSKQGILSIAIFIPSLIFIIILPLLTKKIDKFKIFIVCIFGQIVVSVISYFVGYNNEVLFMVFLLARGLFWGGNTIMMLMFTPDFIEYGEFKTGKRLQGTMNSIQTFICKLFTALSGGIVMFVMSAAGFKEGVRIIQTPNTLAAIWVLLSLMPAVGGALSLIFFLRYRLNDKDSQLMAKVNSGEITREEAVASFTGKY
jgi:sugar (glycoside-pentoside-hexuronide) transporter